jgi:hypothetical protein
MLNKLVDLINSFYNATSASEAYDFGKSFTTELLDNKLGGLPINPPVFDVGAFMDLVNEIDKTPKKIEGFAGIKHLKTRSKFSFHSNILGIDKWCRKLSPYAWSHRFILFKDADFEILEPHISSDIWKIILHNGKAIRLHQQDLMNEETLHGLLFVQSLHAYT